MSVHSKSPIGLLDSGWGGLSVALEVRRALPAEDLLFAADCGFAPWGEKSDAFVNGRIDAVVRFLTERGIKALVIACNTATALAAERLRAELSIPVIGIEPALLPAARATRSGVISVLATPKTIASAKFRALSETAKARYAGERKEALTIIDLPAPGLMQCVEAGDFSGEATRALARRLTAPIRATGADQLVLGCTHYPFLAPLLSEVVGPDVALIDPAPAVARHLVRRLTDAGLLNPSTAPGRTRFFATDPTPERLAVLSALWAASGEEAPELGTLA